MSIVEIYGDSSPRGIIRHWERKSKSECAREILRCWNRIEDLEKQSRVPGVMHCAKCKFQLIRSNLNMAAGTITAGNSDTEPCPNGCGPLWPVTWKQYATEWIEAAEKLQEEKESLLHQRADMAMLIKRLCLHLRKAEPAGDYKRLSDDALDYLRRHDLLGSPMREEEADNG